VAILVTLLIGLISGMSLIKRSERWCPGCGSLLTLDHCPHGDAAVAVLGRTRLRTIWTGLMTRAALRSARASGGRRSAG
jgi:hypothetical protein